MMLIKLKSFVVLEKEKMLLKVFIIKYSLLNIWLMSWFYVDLLNRYYF